MTSATEMISDLTQGPALPWRDGAEAFVARIRHQIPLDSLVVGLLDLDQPRPEGLLVSHEVDGGAVQRWCESGFQQDPLLRDARQRGMGVTGDGQGAGSTPLPEQQHAMVHLQVANAVQNRAWYMALGRRSGGFPEREQKLAALLLRSIQVQFDHVEEAGMGRILLGMDHRLIHADPASEATFVQEPDTFTKLIDTFQPTVEQRWPELDDHVVHGVVLELGGRPTWIRFYRGRQVEGMGVHHWYLELRPVTRDDVPPLGVLEDERIARAVAYLADNYAQAPSLTDVAKAVSTSPFHFHRLFSREVGLSPKHFLLRMQLQMAKWMLRASRTPIGDIASHTGFASHGHFTATFHRLVGVSPTEYREQS
jgi:AraC-like DNA-binding protein